MISIGALITKYTMTDGAIIIPKDEIDIFSMALQGLIPSNTRCDGKSYKHKDPNAPKRPTSSYMFWLNDNRHKIKEEYFGDYDSICDWSLDSKISYFESKDLKSPLKDGKPKILSLVTSKAGKIWKALSEEDKAPFELKFNEAQKEYNLKKESYSPPKTTFDVPDSWSGPHNGMKIMKTLKDCSGKTHKFLKSFDEAVELANKLGFECYGITQTTRGFQVRIGVMEKCEKTIASWTKNGFESKNKSKRGRPKTLVEEPPINNDTIDSDVEDAELEVDEIDIDGTTYYYDETTYKLYDLETSELIGKYENGKIIIAD